MELPLGVGQYSLGGGLDSDNYKYYRRLANDERYDLSKALTTGENIVVGTDGTGGLGTPPNVGAPLRTQFLLNYLEKTSFEQGAAKAMKLLPKEKCYSTTFEWSQFNAYGGPGDGFVGESGTGTDVVGNAFFGVASSDDTFTRLVKTIKFIAAVRQVSLVAQSVRSIENPMTVSEVGATREIIGKANIAIYDGDSKKSSQHWDGLIRQITDWLTPGVVSAAGNPQDQVIMYDAGGSPLTKELLGDIMAQNTILFGQGDLLLTTVQAYQDLQKSLYPEQRAGEGYRGSVGTDFKKFTHPFGSGELDLDFDVMLKANNPLAADGPSAFGLPKSAGDVGAPNFQSTIPLGVAAGAASTGLFWLNAATNLGNPSVVPALPSGPGNTGGSRLPAGTSYYGISAVISGRESPIWVVGASTYGTVTGAAGLAISANQVVTITVDNTKVNVAGSSLSAATYPLLKWRIYRYDGGVAPTSLSQFNLLMETGTAAATSNSVSYDNGMYIPGAQRGFILERKRDGRNSVFMAHLLPLMKREGLAPGVLGDIMAMVYMATPIMLNPRGNMWVRNIGVAG